MFSKFLPVEYSACPHHVAYRTIAMREKPDKRRFNKPKKLKFPSKSTTTARGGAFNPPPKEIESLGGFL
jgi:hypothetical protein